VDQNDGLEILDVCNSTDPVKLGQFDDGGSARGVYVAGNIAYVADWNDGLEIIDVSDPTNPTKLGQFNDGGDAYGVYVVGSIAYVVERGGELEMIDVSNSTNPVKMGQFYDDGGIAEGVYVSGDMVYFAHVVSGLEILRVDLVDAEGPTIHVTAHMPVSPTDSDTVTISAQVTDSSGVSSVTLHYRINGGTWSTAAMSLLSGDTYTVTIGPFAESSTIEYYITALDASSNSNTATDDNGGAYYSFVVATQTTESTTTSTSTTTNTASTSPGETGDTLQQSPLSMALAGVAINAIVAAAVAGAIVALALRRWPAMATSAPAATVMSSQEQETT